MYTRTNKFNKKLQLQTSRLIACCDSKKCKQHFFWFRVCFAIMMNILILSKFDHTFCRFEFEMSYMRFLLNIEIFWDDQSFFICFETEISESVYFLTWRIIVVVIFASKIVDLKNHCHRDFRIESSSQLIINLR